MISKNKIEEFIRVDHAGERGAVKIYEGQLLALNTLVKDEKLKNKFTSKYKIVGKDEADVKNGLLFYQSPMGRGFIGKTKGEFAEIKTPSGEKNFEITNVQYI